MGGEGGCEWEGRVDVCGMHTHLLENTVVVEHQLQKNN